MATDNLFPLISSTPYVQPQQGYQSITRQAAGSFAETLIDITTSEGDRVTLHSTSSQAAVSQSRQWLTENSQGMALSAAMIDSHSFAYSVEGDLSAEELRDLGNLFDSLSQIAADFYEGNMETAVNSALQIGDMGSLSMFSASFSKTEVAMASTYTSAGIPQPANDKSSQESAVARHRQAQWQQILTYLEQRARQQTAADDDATITGNIENHREQIEELIEQAANRHKRLAPLIYQMADKALSEQEQAHQPGPAKTPPGHAQDKNNGNNGRHLGQSRWI